jgi:signal transduction histidine kinase/integral membrane sensor domain MASE1
MALTALRPAESVLLAAVVGLGYVVGAEIGLFLRLPPATPSVVWPPNSILTTALLLTPVSRWWIVLFAALPAHLYIQAGVFAPAMSALLFVTNCSEALIAATVIHRFNDRPAQFNTLRRVTVFLVGAVVLAPTISSFLDAVVVIGFTNEAYWHVWKVRVWSNMLTAVAIIPASACVVDTGWRGVRAWPRTRWAELLIILVLLSGAMVGSTWLASSSGLIGLQGAASLPVLLWMAVRFGPAGVSLSLLASVLILVGAAVSGQGPLDAIPAEQRVAIVQTYLLATGIPFMCVAALIEERRQAESALRTADATKAAILASLPSHVAVLDGDGSVIAANRDWDQFATTIGLGANQDSSSARRTGWQLPVGESGHERSWRRAIRDVQERRLAEFTQEYAHGASPQERWYSVTIVPLQRPGGGVVMTHTDVTERRRAELAAQKSREELAHVTRVWVLGELTASLSHQLNQPLAAISGNAHAGRRFVESGAAAQADLVGVFDDIAADATRAAEIVKDVRQLLCKDTGGREVLDLNDLVGRTLQLIRGEALLRNIRLHQTLAPALPRIYGNRVQLQQVILNLVVNGLESIADRPGQRLISVSTAFEPPGFARVLVHDTGPGFACGVAAQIFEPFYTTKPGGMGMGLAIARAIVEAHGGTIAAEPAERGANLTFTVPLTTGHSGHVL